MRRSVWACLALCVLGAVASPSNEAPAVRFPPLWKVVARDPEQGTWQWEGAGRGGFETVFGEARRHFAAQGWVLRHQTRLGARPPVVLAVWRRKEAELLVLFAERAAAQWHISAGIRKNRDFEK